MRTENGEEKYYQCINGHWSQGLSGCAQCVKEYQLAKEARQEAARFTYRETRTGSWMELEMWGTATVWFSQEMEEHRYIVTAGEYPTVTPRAAFFTVSAARSDYAHRRVRQ